MDEKELETRLNELKKASEKLTADIGALITISTDLIKRVKKLEVNCKAHHKEAD